MSLAELAMTPLGWLLRGRRAGPMRSVRLVPALETSGTLSVSSPSFGDGESIPRRHCAAPRGQNLSPGLEVRGVPSGTRRMLLIIEDVDVPLPRPLIHTIALFDPGPGGTVALVEGALTAGNLAVSYVPASRGRVGYQGPLPLPGHGVHHYGFHVYALDVGPDLSGFAGLDDLLVRLAGHVLASGTLVGTRRA